MTNTEKLDSMIADAAASSCSPDIEVAKGKVWEYAEIGKMVMELLQMPTINSNRNCMVDNVMMAVLDPLSRAPQGSIPVELGPKFMNDRIVKGVQYHLDTIRKKAINEVLSHVNGMSEVVR